MTLLPRVSAEVSYFRRAQGHFTAQGQPPIAWRRDAKRLEVAWRDAQIVGDNAMNASPVISVNTTYGPNWLKPTQILVGHFVKLGAQLDF